MVFLPWHFSLFHRYRHLPASEWEQASRQHPLLQTRFPDLETDLTPLDRLLRSSREEHHQLLADILWEASSADEAVDRASSSADKLDLTPSRASHSEEAGG